MLGTFSDAIFAFFMCAFVTLFVCCFMGVFGSIGLVVGFVVVGLIAFFTLIDIVS